MFVRCGLCPRWECLDGVSFQSSTYSIGPWTQARSLQVAMGSKGFGLAMAMWATGKAAVMQIQQRSSLSTHDGWLQPNSTS